MPTFVGGLCECRDKGGCIGGIANDSYEPKKPAKGEEPTEVGKADKESAAVVLEGTEPETGKEKKKGWFW